MARDWTDGFPGADKRRRLCAFFCAMLLWLVAAPAGAALTFDKSVSNNTTVNSTTASSPVFSTASPNELLLAFVATDYLSGANTTVTSVDGGGLTWGLVVRSNTQAGTSGICGAVWAPPPPRVTPPATPSH